MSDLNLPSGWVEATLGSALISVVGGGTPSRKVPAYFGGQIPWFTVKDMKALKPNDAEEHITEAAIVDSATNLIPANTLIVATRIALGKAIRPTVACAINQDLKALVLGSGINSDFLLHWVGANQQVIQDLGSGTTVSGIRLEALHGLPLLLPPAAEQTRIVEKLEELLSDLDAGVAELKAAQKKLGQYRQSLLKAAVEGALTAEWRTQNTPAETGAQLLQRILTERRARWEAKQLAKFKQQGKTPPKDWQKKYPEPAQPDTSDLPELPEGWVWASVEQLGEVTTGFTPSTAEERNFGGLIPFIKPSDLGAGYYVSSSRESLSELGAAQGRVVSAKSVLVTCIGATIGKTGFSRIPCATNQQINALSVVDGEATPEFLYWMLVSGFGQAQIVGNASATTLPILNKSKFERLFLPLPPLDEQQRIVSALEIESERGFELTGTIERGIKQSTAQRQNILRTAFAGQLVPQHPADEPASVLLARIRAERTAHETTQKSRSRPAKDLT